MTRKELEELFAPLVGHRRRYEARIIPRHVRKLDLPLYQIRPPEKAGSLGRVHDNQRRAAIVEEFGRKLLHTPRVGKRQIALLIPKLIFATVTRGTQCDIVQENFTVKILVEWLQIMPLVSKSYLNLRRLPALALTAEVDAGNFVRGGNLVDIPFPKRRRRRPVTNYIDGKEIIVIFAEETF